MKKVLSVFHYLSFTAYPFMAAAIYYIYRPFFSDTYNMIDDVSIGLIIMGFALGIVSFKDTNRHTKLDRLVLSKPKLIIGMLVVLCVILFLCGSIALLLFIKKGDDPTAQNLAMGMLSLCLGSFGHVRNVLQTLQDWQKKVDANNSST